jgi:hypothetical protein
MPWYKEVKKAPRERFKLIGFRYHQLDAINATLDGKDSFLLMPTGGGKSLCYKLPAVIQTGRTKGVSVVIFAHFRSIREPLTTYHTRPYTKPEIPFNLIIWEADLIPLSHLPRMVVPRNIFLGVPLLSCHGFCSGFHVEQLHAIKILLVDRI